MVGAAAGACRRSSGEGRARSRNSAKKLRSATADHEQPSEPKALSSHLSRICESAPVAEVLPTSSWSKDAAQQMSTESLRPPLLDRMSANSARASTAAQVLSTLSMRGELTYSPTMQGGVASIRQRSTSKICSGLTPAAFATSANNSSGCWGPRFSSSSSSFLSFLSFFSLEAGAVDPHGLQSTGRKCVSLLNENATRSSAV
mmetsp:Transcript_103001/g.331936  ORF Transcript_103001/g.331936 Transcript_103001/m.331936 type:complete len:202 (+) Transcript_103001:794-1399(+)